MSDSSNAERYLILLEDIQGQVRLLAEAQEHSTSQLEVLRTDMNAMGERLDRRLDKIEWRLDRLEIKVDRNSNEVRELKAAMAG